MDTNLENFCIPDWVRVYWKLEPWSNGKGLSMVANKQVLGKNNGNTNPRFFKPP